MIDESLDHLRTLKSMACMLQAMLMFAGNEQRTGRIQNSLRPVPFF
ncbi:hypothetical protein CHCC20335_3353 [Bacillus paralicheniformis]|nr:hypothetical protein CHCC20335_3353 [Bacillus paralicheniformis]